MFASFLEPYDVDEDNESSDLIDTSSDVELKPDTASDCDNDLNEIPAESDDENDCVCETNNEIVSNKTMSDLDGDTLCADTQETCRERADSVSDQESCGGGDLMADPDTSHTELLLGGIQTDNMVVPSCGSEGICEEPCDGTATDNNSIVLSCGSEGICEEPCDGTETDNNSIVPSCGSEGICEEPYNGTETDNNSIVPECGDDNLSEEPLCITRTDEMITFESDGENDSEVCYGTGTDDIIVPEISEEPECDAIADDCIVFENDDDDDEVVCEELITVTDSISDVDDNDNTEVPSCGEPCGAQGSEELQHVFVEESTDLIANVTDNTIDVNRQYPNDCGK